MTALIEDDPTGWDEHLEYCRIADSSSVHTSAWHTSFELNFRGEMRIKLDAVVGGVENCNLLHNTLFILS